MNPSVNTRGWKNLLTALTIVNIVLIASIPACMIYSYMLQEFPDYLRKLLFIVNPLLFFVFLCFEIAICMLYNAAHKQVAVRAHQRWYNRVVFSISILAFIEFFLLFGLIFIFLN